jgi:hypothetical protein
MAFGTRAIGRAADRSRTAPAIESREPDVTCMSQQTSTKYQR